VVVPSPAAPLSPIHRFAVDEINWHAGQLEKK